MTGLVGAGDNVISAFFLVGGDVVWIVYGRQRSAKLFHIGCHLALKIPLKDSRALHCSVEGKTRNIPTTEHEVIGVDHW